MDKDYLNSQKLFLNDTDFDFSDKTLTLDKSQSHENRFKKTQNFLKTEENKRNSEISRDIQG